MRGAEVSAKSKNQDETKEDGKVENGKLCELFEE